MYIHSEPTFLYFSCGTVTIFLHESLNCNTTCITLFLSRSRNTEPIREGKGSCLYSGS